MKNFKLLTVLLLFSLLALGCSSVSHSVESPDGNIKVEVFSNESGKLFYSVKSTGSVVIEQSALGLDLEDAVFSEGMEIVSVSEPGMIEDCYELLHGKQTDICYEANEFVVSTQNEQGQSMDIIFRLFNDGVGFRYHFPDESGDLKTVKSEATSFCFPEDAKAWLQPMAEAKTGWARTNPSYEEDYYQEIAVGTESPIGHGWVYPALFNSNDTWVLIAEANMDRTWAGTKLVPESGGNGYKIGFPQPEEVMPGGERMPNSDLPWYSPWRIITIGDLGTIVESHIGTNLAAPEIQADFSFVKPGIAAWSWVMLKDESVNYEVQKRFIDFAADMNWSHCLVDVNWDQNIGYERIAELSDYAADKGIGLHLWYNSSGEWNDTPYTPKGRMIERETRRSEFERIKEIGISGVKIDFFAGDGQSVMAYYHDILNDAAEFGLMVNFHGTTLPRGWHRTYPHMMTSESIKGYEFITFLQETADNAPHHMTMPLFTRNVFDPMDFTPMNLSGVPDIERRTTNGFELATAILYTSGIQHMADTPEGISTVPEYVKEFLTELPDGAWDESRFVDGFPGQYAVVARRAGDTWYISGINGEEEARNLDIKLPFDATNMSGTLISDGEEGKFSFSQENVELNNEDFNISIQPYGGFVLVLK